MKKAELLLLKTYPYTLRCNSSLSERGEEGSSLETMLEQFCSFPSTLLWPFYKNCLDKVGLLLLYETLDNCFEETRKTIIWMDDFLFYSPLNTILVISILLEGSKESQYATYLTVLKYWDT